MRSLSIRYYGMALGIALFTGVESSDIVYVTLPLYHTSGGALGIGQMIFKGCTIALRTKFSASMFWNDCIRYRATVSVEMSGRECGGILRQGIHVNRKIFFE